ncbi:hypothetical protein M8J75_011712 [Diaphorina citri]|nr:hypothetical protein M8J75_011712 [Diaphorina citri]
MEIDRYILSLQRVLNIKSSYENFDPEKDIELLNEVTKSIRTNCPFLDTESSIIGDDENSRKVHAVLFLHTEFETSNYYTDHDEVACIVGILPKLSPVFYLLLINKLKLNQYLKEMLFYSSAVVANHVLEVINKNVKYYELDETLEFYEHIIKVLYLKLKYLELEYHEREGLSNQMESLTIGDGQKSDSQQSHSDRQPIIRAKYSKFIQNFKIFGFEFCNNLLSSSRLRGFDKNESTVFEGYLLLSHVRILIFVTNVECFGNNGHNEEVQSKQCVRVTSQLGEFYRPFSGDTGFDYTAEWGNTEPEGNCDLFVDCYGDLLYDLIKVLTPISSNSWFVFYETPYARGKTLQTEIGEHAYYLNTLLKQALAKGYDHTRMQQITTEYLPHLCIKPITEEDLILKSLPEQLIAAFQENSDVIKNRPRWLNSALRFFNARHDEIMTIFESNLDSVDCATVFCLHDMIMDRLSNEDLALSQLERDRLVHLLLNSLTHLSLSEQVKVVATFVEKYAGELCSVFPPSGEAEEWLNVVCSLSLKHILQSPHSTLSKLLTISLKSKPDQSCMALVIQCLVDTLLPHFGNLDLRESALDANQDGGEENGGQENQDGEHYFLLDYFADVLMDVRGSLEKGEMSFVTLDEGQDDMDGGDEEKSDQEDAQQKDAAAFDLKSLAKLSQQDLSNVKPMLSLLFKKQVLNPAHMFERCLWPQLCSAGEPMLYEYLSFVTDILMIYFESNSDFTWTPTNEILSDLFCKVKSYINQCTCIMSEFIKEKYFARQQLILLMTSLLGKYKDNLDLTESPEMPHPDWLKLFLNKDQSLQEMYKLNDDKWNILCERLSTSECLVVVNAVRVLIQLVESRTHAPCTVEPYVNCLHQTMICFINVLKDIFLPRLHKCAKTLPPGFNLTLVESLTSLLASFKSPHLEQVKMYAILNLENIIGKLIEQMSDVEMYLK